MTWISVEDRLPEIDGDNITSTGNHYPNHQRRLQMGEYSFWYRMKVFFIDSFRQRFCSHPHIYVQDIVIGNIKPEKPFIVWCSKCAKGFWIQPEEV